MKIKRGDIFLADLGEGYGSEQGGIRPVLVVQNNKGNKHSHTLLVACITSKAHSKHYLPTHYIIPKSFLSNIFINLGVNLPIYLIILVSSITLICSIITIES